MDSIVLSGTGYFVPSDSISNEEIVASFNQHLNQRQLPLPFEAALGEERVEESKADFIVNASGIRHRRVVDKNGILDPQVMHPIIPKRSHEEMSLQCEMALIAAQEALERARKKPEEIDAVIVACSNMQRPYPAISIELQSVLGIKGFAYDMNAACSSAVFGIHLAHSLIGSKAAKNVLVANPEIYTAHLNFRDRRSHFIFGDGCSASVIERKESSTNKQAYRIVGSDLQTQFSNHIRNNFGFLNRCERSDFHAPDKLFSQNGKKVREEVVPLASQHILNHLEKYEISPNSLKRLWLHQANIHMNQSIAKNVLGRSPLGHELPLTLEEYGNTGASGVMIAFHRHHEDLNFGDLGVMCAFGAGYTVGSIILEKV